MPKKNGRLGGFTAPGKPDYAPAGNTQTAGQSYNEAVSTSTNGTNWKTVNDDDNLAGDNDINGADISVWATVLDNKPKAYKVDFAWGPMQFEYNTGGKTWDTTNHRYNAAGPAAAWTATYLNGTNNKVAVTNHSNNGINAAFVYAMSGTKFNDANGQNNVIGNFFDTNAKALTASAVLANIYSDAIGTVNNVAVADKLAGPVVLATADAYNSSATNPTDNSSNVPVGPRTKDVYFAFSGTPDDGKDVALKDFKKVGVITVTVTPNNDIELNRPAFK